VVVETVGGIPKNFFAGGVECLSNALLHQAGKLRAPGYIYCMSYMGKYNNGHGAAGINICA